VRKILVFGNSGSGKTTLASALHEEFGLSHLDLDTLAWLPGTPPQRSPLAVSVTRIAEFAGQSADWVIEGCYADLLEVVAVDATEMIYMDLSVSACIANARARPWEPQKYQSKQAQDANLAMLLEWIGEYETRDDTFSRAAHQKLYDRYSGNKRRITANP
jgi:adenylate kinase family enzyme